MVKAAVRIVDHGPMSIEVLGIKFRKGITAYVTNESDIRQLQMDPTFHVEMVQGTMPPALIRTTPPPKPTDDADDDDLDDADDSDDLDADDEDKDDPVELPQLTRDDLEAQNKSDLIALAESDFGLKLEPAKKKSELIDAILAAQSSKGDE